MNQRALASVFLGFIFSSSPVILAEIPISIEFPFMAQIPIVLYGIFMIAAGFFVTGAERYKSLLDIYMILGVVIFLLGPLAGFPVGQDFWTTITFVSAIFMGLPVVLLLHLSRKDV